MSLLQRLAAHRQQMATHVGRCIGRDSSELAVTTGQRVAVPGGTQCPDGTACAPGNICVPLSPPHHDRYRCAPTPFPPPPPAHPPPSPPVPPRKAVPGATLCPDGTACNPGSACIPLPPTHAGHVGYKCGPPCAPGYVPIPGGCIKEPEPAITTVDTDLGPITIDMSGDYGREALTPGWRSPEGHDLEDDRFWHPWRHPPVSVARKIVSSDRARGRCPEGYDLVCEEDGTNCECWKCGPPDPTGMAVCDVVAPQAPPVAKPPQRPPPVLQDTQWWWD